MAAGINKKSAQANTIAFTLPISCQICLGKVKQPVLCPNNHVFCSSCMDTWLERNQQCPACRTPITEGNPCKQILGGICVVDEKEENMMTNPELRRTRFEMLFNDYESEMCQVQAKMEVLKIENTTLRQQLDIKKEAEDSLQSQEARLKVKVQDIDSLTVLTKKLHEATRLYEKVKHDIGTYKKVNGDLKEENDLLLRENQRLKMEISSRSPHRYGRTTVAALQSQIDTYEKEVNQLNKALQKSDSYIEELEQEVYALKETSIAEEEIASRKRARDVLTESTTQKEKPKLSHKKKLFKDDVEVKDVEGLRKLVQSQRESSDVGEQKTKNVPGILVNPDVKELSKVTDGPGKSPKKVKFSLPGDSTLGSQASSFDLEMPSPLSQASSDNQGPPSSFEKQSEWAATATQAESTTTKDADSLTLREKITVLLAEGKQDGGQSRAKPLARSLPQNNVSDSDISGLTPPTKESTIGPNGDAYDDTLTIENELDELDISLTPELKDCMKLFNKAEKNVHDRNSLSGISSPSRKVLPQVQTATVANPSRIDQMRTPIPGTKVVEPSSSQQRTARGTVYNAHDSHAIGSAGFQSNSRFDSSSALGQPNLSVTVSSMDPISTTKSAPFRTPVMGSDNRHGQILGSVAESGTISISCNPYYTKCGSGSGSSGASLLSASSGIPRSISENVQSTLVSSTVRSSVTGSDTYGPQTGAVNRPYLHVGSSLPGGLSTGITNSHPGLDSSMLPLSSGSAVSNILNRPSGERNIPSLMSRVDSATLLRSQSLLNSISAAPSSQGSGLAPSYTGSNLSSGSAMAGFAKPNNGSSLSASLIINSQGTESLANSLTRLEQTLASHRTKTEAKYTTDLATAGNIPASYAGAYRQGSSMSSSNVIPSSSSIPLLSSSIPMFSSKVPLLSSSTAIPPFTMLTKSSQLLVGNYFPNPDSYSTGLQSSNFQSNSFQANPYVTSSVGQYPAGISIVPSGPGTSDMIQRPSVQPFDSTLFPAAQNQTAHFTAAVPNLSQLHSTFPPTNQVSNQKLNNYSYVSNTSINSDDLSSNFDGSFLPEPKKRLFETDTDDTDGSLFSPVKSSKLR